MLDWAHHHVIMKLSDRYRRPAEDFTLDTPLLAVVYDELDMVELFMSFEDVLSSSIPAEESPLATVGDLIDWFRRSLDR